MIFLKYLLFGFFVFIYCIIDAQTNPKTDKDSLYISCTQCDSLYNQICLDDLQGFITYEHLPEFPGGLKSLMSFINNNIEYPAECKEKAIQGRVIVKFIIDESGKIICPYIINSIHPLLDEETLRIIKLMPDWEPAKNRGKHIKSCFALPVTFKL